MIALIELDAIIGYCATGVIAFAVIAVMRGFDSPGLGYLCVDNSNRIDLFYSLPITSST